MVGHSCYAAETCTHSTNCADDRRDSPGAAFGPVLDMPVVVRQVHSPCVKVVGNTVVAQRLSPLVLTSQKTIAMLVSRQSSSHSCNRRIRAWTRSLTCPLCATTYARGSACRKTAKVPQLQCSFKVADVLVVQVVLVPQVLCGYGRPVNMQ